jgi:hypothetical protein
MKEPALKSLKFLSHGTLELFSQGSDLQAWGAGKADQVNPNQFKGRPNKP